MSQYTEIFYRTEDDKFVLLASYSASSYISQALKHYAPWAKICPLTKSDIKEAIQELEDDIKNYEKMIKEDEDRILFLRSLEGTTDLVSEIEAKMEFYNDYQRSITETEEIIEDEKAAIIKLDMLEDILDCNNDVEYPVLYCGTEAGYPTMEDVVNG